MQRTDRTEEGFYQEFSCVLDQLDPVNVASFDEWIKARRALLRWIGKEDDEWVRRRGGGQ